MKMKLNPTAHVVLLVVVFVIIGVFVYQTAQSASMGKRENNAPTERKDAADNAESDQENTQQRKTIPLAQEQGSSGDEISVDEPEQESRVSQLLTELQNNVTALAAKVEPYYQELESLILGSEEKMAELTEKVEKLEARVAHLEFFHSMSLKLFEARPCTESPKFPQEIPEWNVRGTTVEVEIKEGDRAIISSTPDGGGNYVYDDYLYINGTNVGKGFSGFNGPTGAAAEVAWRPVEPKDVTPLIPTGKTKVRFELRDTGAWHGNTDLYLTVFREHN